MTIGIGPSDLVCEYWESIQADKGRIKGPIHLVCTVLKACSILPKSPILWQLPSGQDIDILQHPDFTHIAKEHAVSAIWSELASQRQGYAGLANGLDYSATLSWPKRIKSAAQRNRMYAIQQDGVWTPARAARVGAGAPNCLHGGQTQADVTHL